MRQFLEFNFNRLKRLIRRSPLVPLIIVILIVSILAGFAIKNAMTKSPQNKTISKTDDRFALKKPIAQQTLNKTFTFPLKNASDKVVSKLNYEIESVELRSEILVKGQKATSLKGRAFLVVNVKITNSYSQAIQIPARNYIRFIINGSPEKLAPDIHNDPVEVQAISTKPTRVGIAVNETDKDIVLQIGEIDGEKQLIKLNLK